MFIEKKFWICIYVEKKIWRFSDFAGTEESTSIYICIERRSGDFSILLILKNRQL